MKKWIDYIWVGCWVLVVNKKHEVLLLKRTDKWNSWCHWEWTRPWWGIEFWETVEEALKREVLEEIWVDIELFGNISYIDDIRKENWIQYHWIWFACFWKILSWELKNLEPEKHSEIKWFSLDNLPEKIANYTMVWILEYREYLKGK